MFRYSVHTVSTSDVPDSNSCIPRARKQAPRNFRRKCKSSDILSMRYFCIFASKYLNGTARDLLYIPDSDGRWHIEDLHLRLACHGQKVNHQFFNRSDLLFNWFERVQTVSEGDKELSEDFLYGDDFDDQPSTANTIHRFFYLAISKLLRLLKAIRKKW